MRVSRTCTEIREGNDERRQEMAFRPLEEYRSVPAYVLLGDPGAGKTTAFEMEREALGENACKIDARDFRTFDPKNHPEWRGKTLFIDGLDEVRAGSSDANTPFDEIRNRLDTLGKPPFRLSCREADWLGANDRDRLEYVSPDSAVTVLRLDPLTDPDVVSILDNLGIKNPHVFISSARENGADGLLYNPQTLELLAEVVGDGGQWPASRKELFEEACDKMVREHNKRHKAAKALSNPPEPARLLDAAGRLCAVQLISGAAGWTLHGEEDAAYPEPDKCQGYPLEVLRSALGTKLFKAVSGDNRFISIHRHIAEFLAARHLAGVIEAGVPARRIITLITGKDGMVVTEMRGLSGWLAAHCEDVRAGLIEQDPIGVGLYGNIPEFSLQEKRALLLALNREASRPGSYVWKWDTAFRALATPELESDIKRVLTNSSREAEHQRVVGFVLGVLETDGFLPRLSGIFLQMVRDNMWWPDVNALALDAFLKNCPDSEDKVSQLKGLLADIKDGSVSDPDNELLGTLLLHLYPRDLLPSEVWEYFFATSERLFFGRHYRFWASHLVAVSSDEQVAELLDGLSAQISIWYAALNGSHAADSADPISYEDFLNVYPPHSLERLPVNLLARGLKAHGDRIDAKHLYDWLGVGLAGGRGSGSSGQKALSEIRLWMEHHSEVQKEVISEGLERCSASDSDKDFDICTLRIWKRLYGASRPPDYGLWCLEQAVALEDTSPHIAEHLLGWAFLACDDPDINEGLSLEVLKELTRKSETLRAHLDRLLAPRPISPWKQERREQEKKYAEEARQEKEKLLAYVRSNEAALRENRAIPYLLHQIARAYFGVFAKSSGCNGPEAVKQWLHGDRNLTDAALQGLRGVMDREDVPDVEEILDLYERNYRHYLVWPFLVGLVEVKRTAPEDDALQWGDDRIRKAVMFWYCASYSNDLPQWYERLLLARPEIVAEVQVQFAISAFRNGSSVYELYALAHRPNHAQAAKHASLPLLRAFPVRCTLKQVQSLDYLLWAAIRHADRTSLAKLIERKRSLTSMNVAQRIRWLAAGTIIAPEAFGGALEDFVQAQKRRIRSLWEFIDSGVKIEFAFRDLDISVMEFLIRLVGGHFGPKSWGNLDAPLGEMTLVTPEMKASDFVSKQIPWLAKSPEEEASDALTNLLDNPALERWRDTLKQAQDNQRTIRRDAGYRHPDIKRICETLDDGTPANPADLAALLIDRLCELVEQIRTGNTDDWRQYWNTGKGGQSDFPKHEDLCRDALLSDLQQRLPQGVDAQREGSYANDKRADIRVSCTHASAGYFQVPVEVKKNSHPKLWSAIHEQLIAKYTIDPDTDGYGIYLVFWFGKEDTKTPHKRGYPADAEEMKKWLEDSLSPEEARKISVCVIDVSIPEGKSAGK